MAFVLALFVTFLLWFPAVH